jgi:hypothetical protein
VFISGNRKSSLQNQLPFQALLFLMAQTRFTGPHYKSLSPDGGSCRNPVYVNQAKAFLLIPDKSGMVTAFTLRSTQVAVLLTCPLTNAPSRIQARKVPVNGLPSRISSGGHTVSVNQPWPVIHPRCPPNPTSISRPSTVLLPVIPFPITKRALNSSVPAFVESAQRESESSCKEFIAQLREQGLRGAEPVINDDRARLS